MLNQISVVVLNYNGIKLLKDCLDSLRTQSLKASEIILVDNGSSDDSVNYVSTNYPEINIIALESNLGFTKGINIGIKACKYNYIVLLNNDTKTDTNWLKALKDTLDANPNVGICASKVLMFYNKNQIDSVGDSYTIAGTSHKIGHMTDDNHKYNSPRFTFSASASAAIYRKEVFEKIGLFDEDFFHGYEDVDIAFRAQLAGFKCLYVPEAIVYHRLSSTFNPGSSSYVYNSQLNIEYLFLKNMPSKLLRKYIILHVIYNLGAFVYFSLKRNFSPFLKAKLDFIRNINLVIKKRKHIQHSKTVTDEYIESLLERKWLSNKINKIYTEISQKYFSKV